MQVSPSSWSRKPWRLSSVPYQTACKREDEVILPDFGRFVVQQYAEHRIVHPKTGEPMVIPATERVRFKAFGNISYYSQKYRL